MARTNPTVHSGLIGVYFPQDPKGSGDEKEGKFTLALGEAWNRGISIEMGQAPVEKYNVYLRSHRGRKSETELYREPSLAARGGAGCRREV